MGNVQIINEIKIDIVKLLKKYLINAVTEIKKKQKKFMKNQ
jgi:hypothetical protein